MSTTIGFGDQRSEGISQLIDELEANCSEPRQISLACQLGEALEPYVGIDREILTEALWRTIHSPSCNR